MIKNAVYREKEVNMALITLTVELDDAVVTAAEVIFAKRGIDMEKAINLFLQEVIFQQKMPFEIVQQCE